MLCWRSKAKRSKHKMLLLICCDVTMIRLKGWAAYTYCKPTLFNAQEKLQISFSSIIGLIRHDGDHIEIPILIQPVPVLIAEFSFCLWARS
ncbi:hypothetical protein B0T20DRAFT_68065 [Sordaria brevicollis]|uniref:Uncharacterized protein n=1 Tax=Sordaria brevicollis TaxID=83679 RepID=A0AAE0P2B1_SORBR|nr:hypothetical protein B0T20DRAFT_68065 [Sordaria brevicollis]